MHNTNVDTHQAGHLVQVIAALVYFCVRYFAKSNSDMQSIFFCCLVFRVTWGSLHCMGAEGKGPSIVALIDFGGTQKVESEAQKDKGARGFSCGSRTERA